MEMGELGKVYGEASEKIDTKVVSISVNKAKEIFGEEARNPARLMIEIETENGASVVTALPQGTEYDEENDEWKVTDKRAFQRSVSNARSKFGKWLRKYEEEPHVGQEVFTMLDSQGFERIIL